MKRRELVVIANPRSGRRRSRDIAKQITATLESAGFQVQFHETRSAGHATELARTLPLERSEALGVIGGDGTMHEVLNGMMTRADPLRRPLAVFAGGTGNTVMEHLQCGDPMVVADHLIHRRFFDVDLIEITMQDRVEYGCNIVGWGAVTDINQTAEKIRWLGRHRYTVATLWQLIAPPVRSIRIRLGGEVLERELLFLVACNTQCTGRGMRIAPQAKINDGKLDVIMVRAASRRKLLRLFQRVFDGRHLDDEIVECVQASQFELWTSQPMGLNLDGELRGTTPCRVNVQRQSLRLVASPEHAT